MSKKKQKVTDLTKTYTNMSTATAEYTTGEQMTDFNLGDIPDLSALVGGSSDSQPWENAWYGAQILGKREFEDKNGNMRTFESNDSVAASGESRNIRLQVEVTRASDGKKLNISYLLNYRPSDLTSETVAAVIADNAKERSEQDASLTRSRLTLARLAALQKIAGVRAFQRTDEGGLDISPLFGKSAYVRLKDDDRNPQFKAVADFRLDRPTKAKTL